MSPTHSVLNTMTLIRVKYFNPQATKPFCTTQWEQTRLRHQSTVKGIYYNWKDLFYLNCKKCHESFQYGYIFLPRSISLSSQIWCSIWLWVNVNHPSFDRCISGYQFICCAAPVKVWCLRIREKNGENKIWPVVVLVEMRSLGNQLQSFIAELPVLWHCTGKPIVPSSP